MLCLKKRRTYSFTQGACADLPRRSSKDNNRFDESLNMAITTLPRKNRSREERPSRMVLTVTEDTPADMLAGSMELLVQLPRDNNSHTQRVTVQRSTPMMDLLVQIATAHKLAASSYTLQAIGERGLVLPHQPNTPIGALDALQVKLLPKQGTFLPRKTKQANQPFETTFRLQVHLPRNQLYVSRVSPKMNLGEILSEVCREKNLDRNKYELRHPANLEETLDLSLSLQDYHLQEVTLYAKQGRSLGSALSTQDIMALQRQEERRRQQAKQGVFGFIFKKSKESSLSTDSLGGRSVSPARSDETGRSASPLAPPARPQRKRRPAPKPPVQTPPASTTANNNNNADDNNAKDKDKMVISHSRNSSDSSGYHEASVLSDNPDSAAARLPETLPRRSRIPSGQDIPRKLAQTSQASKSLGNLAAASGSLGHAVSSTSLSSTGLRKKRAAPPPPVSRPLSSAISTQALERIVDSEESLTSDMDPSKPPSDIGAPSKACSDIDVPSKANSDLGIGTLNERQSRIDTNLRGNSPRESEVEEGAVVVSENSRKAEERSFQKPDVVPVDDPDKIERSRVPPKRVGEVAPLPAPRKTGQETSLSARPVVPKRRYPPSAAPRTSRPASQVSASDETTNDPCPRENLAKEHEVYQERVDPAMKFADEKMKEDLVEVDVTRKDVKEWETESFGADGSDGMSKTQEDTAEESQEFITFSAGANKREEVKGDGGECSKDLDTSGISSVEGTKEDKCEDSNMMNDSEEAKMMKKIMVQDSENSIVRNVSEYMTEVKGNDMLISQEDIRMDDKDNVVNDAMNINDNDNSIIENSHIDAEKTKLNVYNRTYSIDFDPESGQQSPAITQAVNNKMVLNRDTSCKSQSLDVEIETDKETKKSKDISLYAMRQAKSMNDIHNVDYDNQEKIPQKKSNVDDKKSCIIVSTIPKCDHFDIPGQDIRKQGSQESLKSACLTKSRTLSVNDLKEKVDDTDNEKNTATGNSEVSSPRRTKICRSQSEFRDFEESSFKKQRKHLTSHAQDFAFALNLNLPAKQPKESLMRDTDRENSRVTLTGRSEKPENLSETDILLQKVSDTLSNTLPASSSPVPEVDKPTSCSTEEETTEILHSLQPREPPTTRKIISSKDETLRLNKISATSNETNPNVNSPNATINSQQDTSDYVSAMSEDLSITDWEYQLPDPPSAFRDSNSPVVDGYDTITLRSVDAFRETQGTGLVQGHAENDTTDFSCAVTNVPIRSESLVDKNQRQVKAQSHKEESRAISKDVQRTMKMENRSPVKRSNSEPRPLIKNASNFELRKEVISELENKIETGCLSAGKESDLRKTTDSTPAIAPVENPLSNFTITTYTRQKSLNIFDEVHEQQDVPVVNKLDERVIKTFATLSRNKNLADNTADKYSMKNNACSNGFEPKKPETKDQGRDELTNKWQAINGEKDLHSQQQHRNNLDNDKRDVEKNENMKNARNDDVSKPERFHENKFAAGLTAEAPRNKEKFALWRDNILNRQEEPTKEKQLQSIQVLKSILPQLKQTQQTEENVSEECNKLQEKKRLEMRSNEHSAEPNVVSTRESQAELEQKTSTSKERIKQYTYTGPPAISLGSWSERPSVNVQIKMDTDYKFGKSNTSGTRTLVNLNSRDQTDSANKVNEGESLSRVQEPSRISQDVKRTIRSQPTTLERKEPDEFTRKLITHTTASGFKKPTLNKVSVVEPKSKSEEKPVVMGVELKKSFVERQEVVTPSSNGNEIDTTPVNFKELTKTFGQEVCFRTKPKRVNQNRHSDNYGASVKLAEHGSKPNGHVVDQTNDPMKSNSVENGTDNANHLRTRRYTSVVGINNSLNQSFGQQATNNHSARNNVKAAKINQPMPVVKGFNFQTDTRGSNAHVNQNGFNMADTIKKDLVQKPSSTVPVITGVTLKSASARPKSMPVNVDQRDMLLESIRNFGGSKKLKSVTARY